MSKIEVNGLLGLEEAAQFLDVQPATLYAWKYRQFGPPFVKVGRLLKYKLADLERWVDEQTRTPAAG